MKQVLCLFSFLFLVSVLLFAQELIRDNDPGERSFIFKDQEYDAVIINPRHERIRMHWLSKKNTPYKNINAIKQELERDGHKIVMITNGGMYLQNNIPQGLFICEGKELRPIDSSSNKYGNFYMKPNGVFYTNDSGAYITTTESFIQMHNKKDIAANYATQSGPMLVSNGKINEHFNPQSSNYHLRSGVGILSNGNVIFVISRSNQTTFYDFATIFKDKFGCKNALYLDGAISKMYLPKLRTNDLDGSFGVIISVTAE